MSVSSIKVSLGSSVSVSYSLCRENDYYFFFHSCRVLRKWNRRPINKFCQVKNILRTRFVCKFYYFYFPFLRRRRDEGKNRCEIIQPFCWLFFLGNMLLIMPTLTRWLSGPQKKMPCQSVVCVIRVRHRSSVYVI